MATEGVFVDGSPNNDSLRATWDIVQAWRRDYREAETQDFPLTGKKVLELIGSVIATREQVAQLTAERDALRAALEDLVANVEEHDDLWRAPHRGSGCSMPLSLADAMKALTPTSADVEKSGG